MVSKSKSWAEEEDPSSEEESSSDSTPKKRLSRKERLKRDERKKRQKTRKEQRAQSLQSEFKSFISPPSTTTVPEAVQINPFLRAFEKGREMKKFIKLHPEPKATGTLGMAPCPTSVEFLEFPKDTYGKSSKMIDPEVLARTLQIKSVTDKLFLYNPLWEMMRLYRAVQIFAHQGELTELAVRGTVASALIEAGYPGATQDCSSIQELFSQVAESIPGEQTLFQLFKERAEKPRYEAGTTVTDNLTRWVTQYLVFEGCLNQQTVAANMIKAFPCEHFQTTDAALYTEMQRTDRTWTFEQVNALIQAHYTQFKSCQQAKWRHKRWSHPNIEAKAPISEAKIRRLIGAATTSRSKDRPPATKKVSFAPVTVTKTPGRRLATPPKPFVRDQNPKCWTCGKSGHKANVCTDSEAKAKGAGKP